MSDKLDKRLDKLSSLLKQFNASIKVPKPASIKPPSVPKAPGVAPNSKKDPVKMAQQVKNPDIKNQVMDAAQNIKEALKVSKNGQWSIEKADTKTAPIGSGETIAAISEARKKPVEEYIHTPDIKDTIDIEKHGLGHSYNASDKQKNLVHGLDFSNQISPEEKGMHSGITRGPLWLNNANHFDQAFVKRASAFGPEEHRFASGHLDNDNFNSSKREVLFHNMANNFFGLGEHVPTVGGFKIGGDDWSAMAEVPNAQSAHHHMTRDMDSVLPDKHYDKTLDKYSKNGTLHKMALMDIISGNHDRHPGNFMLDDKGKMWLIDHGTSFDYRNVHNLTPEYLIHGEMAGNNQDKLHKDAVKWLNNLDADKATKLLKDHNVDQRHIDSFTTRLKTAKKLANEGKYDNIYQLLSKVRKSSGPEFAESEHAKEWKKRYKKDKAA